MSTGYRVQDIVYRVQLIAGYSICLPQAHSEYRVKEIGYRVQDIGYRVQLITG